MTAAPEKIPTLSERIRALVDAHPGQFTISDLVALLPTRPGDTVARDRYRRIAGLVYPMLVDKKKLGPMLRLAADGALWPVRPVLDVSPEAIKRRRRAITDRQLAKKRAATAARQAARGHGNTAHARTRARGARGQLAAAPPKAFKATAFNAAAIAPATGQARQDARPAREPLPCSETFIAQHRHDPAKVEVLPTFWSRP